MHCPRKLKHLKDFALWLAYFYVRVPATREKIRHHLDVQKANPETAIIGAVSRKSDEILDLFRSENSQLYDEMVKTAGKVETEEYVLCMVARQNVTSTTSWPGHEEVHHYYMRNNGAEDFARRLCEYDWVWRNSEYGFVIGDNPLARWHNESRRFDVGIEQSGVEITMPLGLNLLLCLDQRHSHHDGQLMKCNEQQTRIYNERQWFAAIKHVYGNSLDLLDFITKPIIGLSPMSNALS